MAPGCRAQSGILFGFLFHLLTGPYLSNYSLYQRWSKDRHSLHHSLASSCSLETPSPHLRCWLRLYCSFFKPLKPSLVVNLSKSTILTKDQRLSQINQQVTVISFLVEVFVWVSDTLTANIHPSHMLNFCRPLCVCRKGSHSPWIPSLFTPLSLSQMFCLTLTTHTHTCSFVLTHMLYHDSPPSPLRRVRAQQSSHPSCHPGRLQRGSTAPGQRCTGPAVMPGPTQPLLLLGASAQG